MKVSYILLALFVIFTNNIVNLPASGQTRYGPEEINKKIRISISQINEDLQSPLARYGLAAFAYEWQGARIATPVVGYEQKEDFQQNFKSVYAALLEALKAKSFPPEAPNSLVDPMVADYEKNYQYFDTFYSISVNKGYAFSEFTADQILTIQAQLSSLLFFSNKAAWDDAMERSYFLPFSKGY